MRIPVIRGVIDRRILVNFQVDPDVMARHLPAPFSPQLVRGKAVAGICLIRLKQVRPRFLPIPWGISSENAAHRIAVEWEQDGLTQQGVYIPRRDTNSRLNTWAGGNLFPGLHHHSKFTVHETPEDYSVTLESDDRQTRLHVAGTVCDRLPATSVFSSVREASEFFRQGALGWSETLTPGKYDGLELRCEDWQVVPLEVEQVESSFFADEARFPTGSVRFDCALLMRNIQHEWHGQPDLCCPAAVPAG